MMAPGRSFCLFLRGRSTIWAVRKASIIVTRVPAIAGLSAVFRVMLDGRQVAVIPPGQTRTVSTTSGDHELYIRIRRMKSSRTLELHLADGQEAHVRCGRPKSALGGVLDLLRFRRFDQENVVPVEILDSAG
jgi:hypothetical protein